MSFIDDDVLPTESFYGRLLTEANLIRSNKDIKVTRKDTLLDYLFTLFFVTLEDDNFKVWTPLREFPSPVVEC